MYGEEKKKTDEEIVGERLAELLIALNRIIAESIKEEGGEE